MLDDFVQRRKPPLIVSQSELRGAFLAGIALIRDQSYRVHWVLTSQTVKLNIGILSRMSTDLHPTYRNANKVSVFIIILNQSL